VPPPELKKYPTAVPAGKVRFVLAKRFTIVHKDAYSAMAGFENQFDLIINDGADLISAASSQREGGFDLDLFHSMTRALKPNGVRGFYLP